MHPCTAKDAGKTPTAGPASENPCPKKAPALKPPRRRALAPGAASGTSAGRPCLSLTTPPSSNPKFLLGTLSVPGPTLQRNCNTGV